MSKQHRSTIAIGSLRGLLVIAITLAAAIAATLGVAPAATAATATSVRAATLNGTPLSIPLVQTAQVISGQISPAGATRTVTVQRRATASAPWQTYVTVSAATTFRIPVTRAWPAGSYRTAIAATATAAAYYGPATTISRPLTAAVLSGTVQRYPHAYAPWLQNSLTSHLDIAELKTTVRLQKLVGSTWTTVSSRSGVGSGTVTFTLPIAGRAAPNGVAQWRLYVEPTAWTKAAGTAFMHVSLENPLLYTGKWKTAYALVRGHCPDNLIMFEAMPAGTNGRAYVSKNHRISLSTTLSAAKTQTAVLHECAHFVQWRLYGANWSAFSARMDALYGQSGGRGIEQNAECIANVWHANSYWGYGKNCAGARGTAAQTIAAGSRY